MTASALISYTAHFLQVLVDYEATLRNCDTRLLLNSLTTERTIVDSVMKSR